MTANKIIIIISLIGYCSICATAQIEKCKYLRNEIDDMTGKRTIQTKFYHIAKTQRGSSAVWASAKKVDSLLYLEVYNTDTDLGCVGVNSEMIFKTLTGKLYTVKHIGGTVCGEYVNLYMNAKIPPTIVLEISGTNEAIEKEGIEMVRITYERRSDDAKLFLPFNFQQLCACVNNAPEPKTKKLKPQTVN